MLFEMSSGPKITGAVIISIIVLTMECHVEHLINSFHILNWFQLLLINIEIVRVQNDKLVTYYCR